MATSHPSRWLNVDDWPSLLKAHLNPESNKGVIVDPYGDPRWQCSPSLMKAIRTEAANQVMDLSLDAIWLEDTGEEMAKKLGLWWKKLKPGGYLGGPSCGFGFTPCGRWTLNTEAVVKRFARSTTDASEIFTGNQHNPCWFVFKREPETPRVLILSGSDHIQSQSFGTEAKTNHKAYAKRHGYDYIWLNWEDFWDEPRHFVWAKLMAVMRQLEKNLWDQVWWVDADAGFLEHFK